jgi:ATP-dependent Zn protease
MISLDELKELRFQNFLKEVENRLIDSIRLLPSESLTLKILKVKLNDSCNKVYTRPQSFYTVTSDELINLVDILKEKGYSVEVKTDEKGGSISISGWL